MKRKDRSLTGRAVRASGCVALALLLLGTALGCAMNPQPSPQQDSSMRQPGGIDTSYSPPEGPPTPTALDAGNGTHPALDTMLLEGGDVPHSQDAEQRQRYGARLSHGVDCSRAIRPCHQKWCKGGVTTKSLKSP